MQSYFHITISYILFQLIFYGNVWVQLLLGKKRQNFIVGSGLPVQESGVCVTNESRPGRHPFGRVDSPPFNQMGPGRTETLERVGECYKQFSGCRFEFYF